MNKIISKIGSFIVVSTILTGVSLILYQNFKNEEVKTTKISLEKETKKIKKKRIEENNKTKTDDMKLNDTLSEDSKEKERDKVNKKNEILEEYKNIGSKKEEITTSDQIGSNPAKATNKESKTHKQTKNDNTNNDKIIKKSLSKKDNDGVKKIKENDINNSKEKELIDVVDTLPVQTNDNIPNYNAEKKEKDKNKEKNPIIPLLPEDDLFFEGDEDFINEDSDKKDFFDKLDDIINNDEGNTDNEHIEEILDEKYAGEAILPPNENDFDDLTKITDIDEDDLLKQIDEPKEIFLPSTINNKPPLSKEDRSLISRNSYNDNFTNINPNSAECSFEHEINAPLKEETFKLIVIPPDKSIPIKLSITKVLNINDYFMSNTDEIDAYPDDFDLLSIFCKGMEIKKTIVESF